jgi:hypothetical protein
VILDANQRPVFPKIGEILAHRHTLVVERLLDLIKLAPAQDAFVCLAQRSPLSADLVITLEGVGAAAPPLVHKIMVVSDRLKELAKRTVLLGAHGTTVFRLDLQCKSSARVAPESATNVGLPTQFGGGRGEFAVKLSLNLCHSRNAGDGERTIAHVTEAAGPAPPDSYSEAAQAQEPLTVRVLELADRRARLLQRHDASADLTLQFRFEGV